MLVSMYCFDHTNFNLFSEDVSGASDTGTVTGDNTRTTPGDTLVRLPFGELGPLGLGKETAASC